MNTNPVDALFQNNPVFQASTPYDPTQQKFGAPPMGTDQKLQLAQALRASANEANPKSGIVTPNSWTQDLANGLSNGLNTAMLYNQFRQGNSGGGLLGGALGGGQSGSQGTSGAGILAMLKNLFGGQ